MTSPEITERTVADRYTLRALIGSGGMGRVWRADDTLLGREVAVKEIAIPPDAVSGAVSDAESESNTLRQRVLREARAAAAVNSPGAVQVYDVLEDTDRAYIVMELVEAPTLDEHVRRDGPLGAEQTAAVGRALIEVLAAAHARGIVHRDVKPANVILCPDGRVKLADFGIASVSGDPRLTQSGLILGSPSFMAPEQAKGDAETPASDVFSLGATLFYAVEGVLPFDRGSPVATLTAVVHDDVPPMAHAGSLAPVIAALLEKDPARRPDLAQVREMLGAPVTPAPVPVSRVLPPQPAGSAETALLPAASVGASPSPAVAPRPRRRLVPVVLVLVLLLAAGVAGALVLQHRHRAASAQAAGSSLLPSPTTPPADWATYQDPDRGYVVHHPAAWRQTTVDATTKQFKDADSGTYLRIATVDPPGNALESVKGASASFAANGDHHDYKELRTASTTYAGKPAALWEYTWRASTVPLHAIWLLVVDGRSSFVLNFQAREPNWAAAQQTLAQLEGGFTPPRG